MATIANNWKTLGASDSGRYTMLDRLHKGGLPHVDATEPDEHVIRDSDDDDAFIDPGAYINDQHYY